MSKSIASDDMHQYPQFKCQYFANLNVNTNVNEDLGLFTCLNDNYSIDPNVNPM